DCTCAWCERPREFQGFVGSQNGVDLRFVAKTREISSFCLRFVGKTRHISMILRAAACPPKRVPVALPRNHTSPINEPERRTAGKGIATHGNPINSDRPA